MKMNFNIRYDEDRLQFVESLLKPEVLQKFYRGVENEIGKKRTPYSRQLEIMADYILCGKQKETELNLAQHKKILHTGKQSTYRRKPDESLEEIIEDINKSERVIKSLDCKKVYSIPKPTITRPVYGPDGTVIDPGDSFLPTITSLWISIDRLQNKLDAYKGKEILWPFLSPIKDSYHAYHINHILIDLRKHQYYIKDSYLKKIPSHTTFSVPSSIDWESNSGYWIEIDSKNEKRNSKCIEIEPIEEFQICPVDLFKSEYYGELMHKNSPPTKVATKLITTNKDKKIKPKRNVDNFTFYWRDSKKYPKKPVSIDRKNQKFHPIQNHILDLTNSDHIRALLDNYDALKKSSYDDLNGQMKYILMTLDTLDERANLTEAQKVILDCKTQKWTNERIQEHLQKTLGLVYNINYISTLYTKGVCEKLAASAYMEIREFNSRNKPQNWKTCKCCGKRLLLDSYYFTKKATLDGFAARCKKCDSMIRKSGVREK